MRSLSPASLAALAFVATLPGCGAPKDPAQALLDDLAAAAEARDAGRVVERLAEGFQGSGGMGRAEARATLQRYFAAYESVGVTVFDVQHEGQQRVRFRVDFSGRPKPFGGLAGLLPSAAVYRFDLELASEGGRLLVSRGSWEPWMPPAE
jgi:hypothetical protein